MTAGRIFRLDRVDLIDVNMPKLLALERLALWAMAPYPAERESLIRAPRKLASHPIRTLLDFVIGHLRPGRCDNVLTHDQVSWFASVNIAPRFGGARRLRPRLQMG